MKKIINILFLLFFSLYLCEDYQLLIHEFFKGEIIYDIELFNQKNNITNYYYFGLIENIESIIDQDFINSETINAIMNEKHNPILYILNKDYLQYINLFPTSTIFIILNELNESLEFGFQNYNIYTINIDKYSFYPKDLTQRKYYVIIGKKIDHLLQYFLNIISFLSLFICIIICFIITKILKNLEEGYQLGIYYIMCISSYILIVTNFINGVYFLIFKNKKYCFIMEYTTILIYSFYKSNLFSIIILVLLGWGTIYFGWGRHFKRLIKQIFVFDLIISILIPLFIYIIHYINKLDLFYAKNIVEYLIILFIFIYSLFKRMIPLYKQMKYEQRIHSNLVTHIELKYNKLFLINIIIVTYTIFFMITPFLDRYFIYFYANSYNIHFTFQIFYESIFFIFFFIAFFPQKLPENYFDDIVFKYKKQIFLVAYINEEKRFNSINDISDLDYSSQLSIHNLSSKKLSDIKKKKKYPIVLINPFVSTKNNNKLFKEIYLGTVRASTQ